ncbi:MAG: transposase [Pseudobacteriovorax sp.]|nr:transposase [Pseudobacteriovorax sp.]
MNIICYMITLLRMITMPYIDNLIHRARYEAACLVKSDLLRLILDMASALELLKTELDYKSDENKNLKGSLFGSKSESVATTGENKNDSSDNSRSIDESREEKTKEELKKLRAEAKKLSKTINAKKPKPNDKMKNEEISSKVPHGIVCPHCNTEVADLGKYREAREIDVHPSRFIDRKVNLHKGSCACGSTTIRMPPPVRASDGSNFSPRFVSRLVLDKFDMSFPVYRQRRMMEYEGLDLNRSTLNRAIARHTNIFGSIAGRIHEISLLEERLNVDESPLRFIHQGKKKTSFLFCFISDKAISYKVQDGRNRKIVTDLIGRGPGVLQTDGLNIYENEELNKDHAG